VSRRRHIFSGSDYEARAGYARAVVDGDWVHVSGTTGFDYATGEIADDLADQARRAIATIAAALAEAGASLDDVVRVRYYLSERAHFDALMPVVAEAFGAARPAATAIIAGLVDPRMKVEIEVTARKQMADR